MLEQHYYTLIVCVTVGFLLRDRNKFYSKYLFTIQHAKQLQDKCIMHIPLFPVRSVENQWQVLK